MEFNDIKQALETTPDLIKQVASSFKDKITASLEAEGLVIRTKEQDDQYLEAAIATHLPDKVKAAVGEQFKKSMQTIDAEIEKLTGIKKDVHEKTTEYAARALEAKRNSGGDPVTKARVQELESQLAALATEKQQIEETAKKQIFDFKLGAQLDQALGGTNIAVPPHIQTEEQKAQYIEMQRQALRGMFQQQFAAKTDETGALIFYEGDKPRLSSKDGKPLGASDLIAEKFGSFFAPVGQKGSGTGVGAQGGATQGAAGGQAFKSSEDIHAHLQAQGLKPGSGQYLEQFQKLSTPAAAAAATA